PLVNSARLAAASTNTAVVFGNGAGSQLLRTTDGGVTWQPARAPHPPTVVSWLGFADSRVGYALVQTGWDTADRVERQELWRKIASTAPAAPRQWPVAPLVDETGVLRAFSSPSAIFSTRVSLASPTGVEVPCALM